MMNGYHSCATCVYFVPLTMMSKEERQMFIDHCGILGIEDYENYGYCTYNPEDIAIVRKDNGRNCKYWEARR